MKKVFSFILLIIVLFSFSNFADAKRSKPTINRGNFRDIVTSVNSAKDSNSLYVLGEKSIEKYSLPDLVLVLSADLPSNSQGKGIDVVGVCSSNENPTILVSVEQSSGEAILSYDKDLKLIATLQTSTVSSDIQNEEGDGNNNDNNGDNGNTSNGINSNDGQNND